MMSYTAIEAGGSFHLDHLERLSQRLSEKRNRRTSLKAKSEPSAQDMIYASILKSLRSNEQPNMTLLVKKASGAMKLSRAQNRYHRSKKLATFDFENYDYDGLKFEEDQFEELLKAEQESGNNQPQFKFHLVENQDKILSQLASNGGNFAEVWSDFEASTSTNPEKKRPSSVKSRNRSQSRSDRASTSTTQSSRSTQKKSEWKYFGNGNVLSSSSTSSLSSSAVSPSHPSTPLKSSQWVNAWVESGKQKLNDSSSKSDASDSRPSSRQETAIHVCVIRGQLVTFQGSGFGFTNWFGDEQLLRKYKLGKGEFRKEVDLCHFSSSEIFMKLVDGHKLVIEAFRPSRDRMPPMRHKSTVFLPKGTSLDRVLMCRTKAGRVIIQTLKTPLVRRVGIRSKDVQ